VDCRRQVRGSWEEIVRELNTRYNVQCTKYNVLSTKYNVRGTCRGGQAKYESETNVEFRKLIEECRSRDNSTKYHVPAAAGRRNRKYESETNVEFRKLIEECRSGEN
jgi:Leu/Phe-tRNA-protein transferase